MSCWGENIVNNFSYLKQAKHGTVTELRNTFGHIKCGNIDFSLVYLVCELVCGLVSLYYEDRLGHTKKKHDDM